MSNAIIWFIGRPCAAGWLACRGLENSKLLALVLISPLLVRRVIAPNHEVDRSNRLCRLSLSFLATALDLFSHSPIHCISATPPFEHWSTIPVWVWPSWRLSLGPRAPKYFPGGDWDQYTRWKMRQNSALSRGTHTLSLKTSCFWFRRFFWPGRAAAATLTCRRSLTAVVVPRGLGPTVP